ncbi:MAG: helix-turn-helix transcriptional regulator [Firmicutes bacterium]|nr:helix-turn-helix transcriptional regulator [Bacillota bacterium]
MKEVSYMSYDFPVIDMAATGSNIKRLRLEKGMSVRQLQSYFGFDEPRAIYKWQRGESLPSVDNLYALGALLEVPMEQILVPKKLSLHIVNEQQDKTCCSVFLEAVLNTADGRKSLQPFLRLSFRS